MTGILDYRRNKQSWKLGPKSNRTKQIQASDFVNFVTRQKNLILIQFESICRPFYWNCPSRLKSSWKGTKHWKKLRNVGNQRHLLFILDVFKNLSSKGCENIGFSGEGFTAVRRQNSGFYWLILPPRWFTTSIFAWKSSPLTHLIGHNRYACFLFGINDI